MLQKSNVIESTRVLLADDHQVVRYGIQVELDKHDDMSFVGEASNGQEALYLAQKLYPDIIVLDISMPKLQGTEVANTLNEMSRPEGIPEDTNWPPFILILSAYCDPEYVYSLFAYGAKGYLLKDESPSRIVEGIRQVMRGQPALSLPVQSLLLQKHTSKTEHDLSVRELDVLRLIAKGYTNDEIASTLVIAVGTVKNHVTNIYRKLPNVRSRSEAVAWAWESKIVVIEE